MNNLLIMTACKTDEAREFYIRSCIENHYSKRETECQIDSMLYERTVISDAKYGQLAKRNEELSVLRDTKDLTQIKSLADATTQTPYSDYCSDK